jgi:8-oxo-dGTP pyrophosphatase MutT (NUDIX family)
MPLASGSSREVISANIRELVEAGHSQSQSVAIALSKAAQSRDAVAAGVLIKAPDGDILFVRRSASSDHPGEWAFPGGHLEAGETPQQAAARELQEETGQLVDPDTLGELLGVHGGFNTYHLPVREKITPTLNAEHTEYCWAKGTSAPQPLHPGVAETLALALPDSAGLIEYEVGDAITIDRGYFAPIEAGKTRRLTPDGFLICEEVGIARTGTQVYSAADLPGLQAGPDGKIIVERTPEEVFAEDTIASFEGKDVTIYHPNEFVSPENWKQHSVGHVQNVRRGEGKNSDLLIGDIIIKDAAAVHYAMQKLPDISCGYDAKYKVHGPGRASQHDIRGNHAALVPNGRAGDRCAIRDNDIEEFSFMSKSTVAAAISSFFKGKGMPDAAAVELQNLVMPLATTDEADPDDRKSDKTKDAIDALSRDMKRFTDWMESEQKERKEAKDRQTAKDAEEAEAAAKKKKEAEEETSDTIIEAEEVGHVISLGKVWNGKTGDAALTEIRARAEILAPGMSMPTGDAVRGNRGAVLSNYLRTALKTAHTKDAALVEPFLLGRTIDSLRGVALIGAFNGATELMKIRNNASTRALAGGMRTADGSVKPPMTSSGYAENLAKIRKEKAAG